MVYLLLRIEKLCCGELVESMFRILTAQCLVLRVWPQPVVSEWWVGASDYLNLGLLSKVALSVSALQVQWSGIIEMRFQCGVRQL